MHSKKPSLKLNEKTKNYITKINKKLKHKVIFVRYKFHIMYIYNFIKISF